MELSPQDLGNERYLTVMRRRLTPLVATQNGTSSIALDDEGRTARGRRIRGRRVRRYWVKDLALDEETSESLGNALWQSAPGVGVRVGTAILSIYLFIPMLIAFASGNPQVAPFIAAFWGLMLWLVYQSPRATVKRLHKKRITTTEIDNLLPNARGRLERTYLNLIGDALRQSVPSESAQSDIRSALRDLGEAISRLPADAVPSADPDFLRRESARCQAEAASEADSFVRASLLRQAEAFERRAALGDQNAHSARRATALRREAKVQMDSLRSVLVAFNRTSATDAAGVAHLAESVSRVAQEAQAVSVARRELEENEITALLGHQVPVGTPTQPIQPILPARKVVPVPSTPNEQAPQVVQTRNWWRNQS